MIEFLASNEHEEKKERHFQRLQETTDAVWPIILQHVNQEYARSGCEKLSPDMQLYFKRRENKKLLRPYLVRLAYELAGGKNWRSILDIMAAAELFNISTYQSNLCFDQKVDFEYFRPENQYISSMVTLSLAAKAITSQSGISPVAQVESLRLLAECNAEVYEGQFFDINVLSIDSSGKFLTYEFDERTGKYIRLLLDKAGGIDVSVPEGQHKDRKFLNRYSDSYLLRCKLIGGSTFKIAMIGAIAAAGETELVNRLSMCLVKFGMAAQIINDLADYIPLDSKKGGRPYADSYGDLKMGRLTYPTFLMMMRDFQSYAMIKDLHDKYKHGHPSGSELLELTNFLKSGVKIKGKVEQFIGWKIWRGKSGIKEQLRRLEKIADKPAYCDLQFISHFVWGSRMLRYWEVENER